jgi:hypothetical protein
MIDPEENELLLKGLKGDLSEAERSALRTRIESDSQFKAAWEEELALEQLLGGMPNAPLSTNFTSLVLQKVSASEARLSRPPNASARWFGLRLARIAATLAVIGITGFGLNHLHQEREQARLADGVHQFTAAASEVRTKNIPAVEMFKNFDAIQKLGHVPRESDVDMELLVALER